VEAQRVFDSTEDGMVIFGIICEIMGFVMILKSEGKAESSSNVVDAPSFLNPVKIITNIKRHDAGILLVIIGLILQIVAVFL
jgi:hypothetical protein